jgi:hypothetical protein
MLGEATCFTLAEFTALAAAVAELDVIGEAQNAARVVAYAPAD